MPDPTPAPAPVAAPASAPSAAPVVAAPVLVTAPPAAPTSPAPAPAATVAPAPPAPVAPAPAPVSPIKTSGLPAPLAAKPVPEVAKIAPPLAPAPGGDVANLPQAEVQTEPEPARPKGLPEEAPFRFADVPADKLDEAAMAQAIQEAREDFRGHAHPFGQPVAHPDYPASGYLQGYDAATRKVTVMFEEAEGNPTHSHEFADSELFDPVVALSLYNGLTAPPPAASPSGVPGAAAAVVAMVLAILTMLGNVACTDSQTAGTKTAAAKIGTIVKTIETPPVVQKEAQVLTAEILQRAVSEKKQATVAGWCTCISRGIMDLTGKTDPSAADLQAAIESEAGPQTDPEFATLVATAVDFWTVTKAAIPAGSSAQTVEAYLFAAATGVQNAAANYLPAPTAAVAAVWLEKRHQANLFFFRLERERRARHRH